MLRLKICRKALEAAAACLMSFPAAYAADNPLAKYLEVPGAKTTLPVSSAKSPFPLEFDRDAQKRFENFHYQLGGDHALYYNLHLSELLHTAVSKPNQSYRPLDKVLVTGLGDKVFFKVNEGDLTLNQYVVHPNHRVQAVVMIHKGKIVYETYPGMNPMDQHVWMSPGKSTVGLVIARVANDAGFATLPDGGRTELAVCTTSSSTPVADRERAIAETARAAYDHFATGS